MRRALVIAVALLGGCRDEQLAQLAEIKNTVCGCKTASCAEDAMKRVPQHDVEANQRTQQVAKDMIECLSRLYEAEQRPATDPDQATGPGSSARASGGTP